MKKVTIILIGLMVIMSFVYAAPIITSFVIDPAKWTPTTKVLGVQNGNVTFLCGKDTMKIEFNEPSGDIDDDFEKEVREHCTKEISNVVDWNGREYKQNEFGKRSFDEDVLKRDVCRRASLKFDGSDCVNDTQTESIIK